MKVKHFALESATAEALRVTVVSRADPTGTNPNFEMLVHTATSPTGTWSAGTWDGSWDPVSGEVSAITPVIGTGQTLDLTENQFHKLWMQWTHGSETPVKLVAIVEGC